MSNTFLFSQPECSACGGFAAALRELSCFTRKKILKFEKKVYTFDKADSVKMELPVSNTIEKSDRKIKSIGLCIENINDLTIDGNGAKLLMNGDMSAIVLKNCRNITLKDLTVDYIRPRVSEMRVQQVVGNTAEFLIHEDSRWELDGQGRFCWVNADGDLEDSESRQAVQAASPDNSSNLRMGFNPVRDAVKTEIIEPDRVKFTYLEVPPVEVGQVWQFRDPSRRENGVVITNCENVTLNGMELNFTPGLGIVAQMTRNISIIHHRHAPAAGSGRVCAAHADCIQISSCRGKVEIADGFFSGAQDDPVNIHGTYLGVQRMDGPKLLLEFGHPETWGFLPFEPGDEIALVDAETLERVQHSLVREAALTDFRHIELTLDPAFDADPAKKRYVVENLSACPEVLVENNRFRCYPTRGLLITTTGVVRKNHFLQASPRPAVYISGGAAPWFESGGVQNLLIEENVFENCSVPAIEINPKNNGRFPLHRGIRIRNNTFVRCTPPYLHAEGCKDIETDIR